jgi:pyridoxal 5'-phosphate synthase pdxT subunit
MLTVGVVAFQGDFDRHLSVLQRLKVASRKVRAPEDLSGLSGLIIPGGESTTIGMLMDRFGLLDAVRARVDDGLAVMGTCAGAILLARDIEDSSQVRIGSMDIRVQRNAYGRQKESFETPLAVREEVGGDTPLVGVFIRAPRITAVGPSVKVLATLDGEPVAVRSGGLIAVCFHPELTGDTRLHEIFLQYARSH